MHGHKAYAGAGKAGHIGRRRASPWSDIVLGVDVRNWEDDLCTAHGSRLPDYIAQSRRAL
jgi:hypothetical protein